VENKKFTLRAGPLAGRTLKAGGIRVVSLANNHMMDFGPLALQDTLAALADNDILYTGAGMSLDDARPAPPPPTRSPSARTSGSATASKSSLFLRTGASPSGT
jgi:poly-gamma-glutamate capsule biosynthesis protein CapA/YwtB (metallophosphatase superfamily)